jgi:transposase-like protein
VARELGIGAGLLGRWKQQLLAEQEEAFPGKGRLKASGEEAVGFQTRFLGLETCP